MAPHCPQGKRKDDIQIHYMLLQISTARHWSTFLISFSSVFHKRVSQTLLTISSGQRTYTSVPLYICALNFFKWQSTFCPFLALQSKYPLFFPLNLLIHYHNPTAPFPVQLVASFSSYSWLLVLQEWCSLYCTLSPIYPLDNKTRPWIIALWPVICMYTNQR